MKMEIKTAGPYDGAFDVVDADQGIVSEIICVYGIVDEGNDRVNAGAFTKTIAENAGAFRVVDSHNHKTVQAVLGVNLAMDEISRDELPVVTQAQFPEATGGVRALTRYLLNTPEGLGAFIRRKEGALPSSSYGYNALDVSRTTEKAEGGRRRRVIRDIHTLRLREYGPCVLPLNPATSVLGVKADALRIEGKPWGVFIRDGEYCVYRTNEDGEAEGESRGCHDTLEAAEEQVAALYVNVDENAAAARDAGISTTGAASTDFVEIVWMKAMERAGSEATAEEVLSVALGWLAEVCAKNEGEAEAGLTSELDSEFMARIRKTWGEGKTGSSDESGAGPDGATSPASDGGPGPDTETSPTSLDADDAALLLARIKIARARLEVDSIDSGPA